jgi:hypothetical protein
MLLQFRTRDGGTDPAATRIHSYFAHFGDAFDVDDQRWVENVGLDLHQQVGTTSEDARDACFPCQQLAGLLDRFRCFIAHRDILVGESGLRAQNCHPSSPH